MMRIRQKEGLSYGVQSELSVGSLDARGPSASGRSRRRRTWRASRRRSRGARAGAQGRVYEAEIANAKSGILQKRAAGRAQDGDVAAAWVGQPLRRAHVRLQQAVRGSRDEAHAGRDPGGAAQAPGSGEGDVS
jgi:hypothetical protein